MGPAAAGLRPLLRQATLRPPGAGRPRPVRAHLQADLGYQRRLVRFLENHDEPRAARTFPPRERTQAYAVAVATLPGLTLWHEGQADGRTVFVPVFLSRRPHETLDPDLADWYRRLWAAAARSAGRLEPLRRRGLAGQHERGPPRGVDLDRRRAVLPRRGEPRRGARGRRRARRQRPRGRTRAGCSPTCSTGQRTSDRATTSPSTGCTSRGQGGGRTSCSCTRPGGVPALDGRRRLRQ